MEAKRAKVVGARTVRAKISRRLNMVAGSLKLAVGIGCWRLSRELEECENRLYLLEVCLEPLVFGDGKETWFYKEK